MPVTDFLALFISLPASGGSERIRLWRGLRALGCGVLRDGVYLLPESAERAAALEQVARDAVAGGGSGMVLRVLPRDAGQEQELLALFDRADAYAALHDELAQVDPTQADLAALRRRVRALSRRLEELMRIDFFDSAGREAVELRLSELAASITGRSAEAEPSAEQRPITRLDRQAYQGRLWATRRNLWVDRLASAWLIRRFIDPQARFVWLQRIEDCPAEALGFDFDGADFTHVGPRVSFETLLASFGLEEDPALLRIASIVHALDVGGVASEAAGVEALLRGLKIQHRDDDRLLEAGGPLFDNLYNAFTPQDPHHE